MSMRASGCVSLDSSCHSLGALFACIIAISFPSPVTASTSAPPSEPLPSPSQSTTAKPNNVLGAKKELEFLNDRPSTDSTPIYFDKGKPKYRIPRNYIVNMGNWDIDSMNNLITLRVTYPGFKPLTDETRDCLTKPPLYWPKGCVPIQFWIGVNGLREENSHVLTDEQRFNNMRDVFHSQVPKPGPDGFEMYETGPDDARIESYRKKLSDRTIYISCGLIQIKNGKRWAQCDDLFSPLANGGGISYRFLLDQMDHAEEIDIGLRKLIMSFTLPESKE
jgi:hypothetical protein